MNWAQKIGLFIAAVPATFAGFILCVARPFHRGNNKACARMYAWGGLRVLNTRVRLEGWQHMPAERPHVMVANHQSNLDLYFYGQITPENAVVVGKKSLGWIPFFGQIFWLGGNVLIQRRHRQKAMTAMNAANQAIACRGQSVWILPEGTRSRGRGLLPFRKGAFQTAVMTGAPITLICFSDYLKAYEQSPHGPHTVTVRVLPPIPTEHLGIKDVPDLMARCRALMIQHLTDLNGESPVTDEGHEQQVA
ncbi:1-acyl-sn-glycerol-3-phosphate acyltransferase [Halospina denitrificans]|uniref:1-acyl-sn-glycerol-3-phosphate acyltransferase n=1 Tax=Halospina denitrificans TaxID=332522 RepID=A0A4R7JGZ9_9GAMM|nr:lysophospholipid acyltransferase family protein [Halospina denitrificans]TDT37092.1 1-acyl-sn-glycerol-3-phosphate acyltransferase [Halospina denitrificans]